ncbi:MAG: CRISPR-associated helicase Cas3' [Candidatus Wallbacteria bacterium]|nr:CRISPR-associated helicase Cas3' [Candidatus Wallbacteria bacterium]
MACLDDFLSHPDKSLSFHTLGVLEKIKHFTSLEIAEYAGLFHDFGKVNPNFQKKIKGFRSNGYSNHSLLSGLYFLKYCAANQALFRSHEKIASILAAIVHHHGDLPDFSRILNTDEIQKLLNFMDSGSDVIAEAIETNVQLKEVRLTLSGNNRDLLERVPSVLYAGIESKRGMTVDNYLDTQFSFSCLINADKSDAGNHQLDKSELEVYCTKFSDSLESYLSKFKNNSELDLLRQEMRNKAKACIHEKLGNGHRLFSLTAPTGSGKTTMLLSLAGEIIKQQGNHRIIYILPFLSITEQVEKVCLDIFKGLESNIRRIDSKTENRDFQQQQENSDGDMMFDSKSLLDAKFKEDSFDYPFVITTFVRFFETLLSNRNATLLKMPNFSKSIFLIDEIQSLPPRLYGFLVAYLDTFCRKFGSYAVLSTATMPNFRLPENNRHDLAAIFKDYSTPPELLDFGYFGNDIFNRYQVSAPHPIETSDLSVMIETDFSSTLVILNTIQDSKELFAELTKKREPSTLVFLLNTHFKPFDRKRKINICKKLLAANKSRKLKRKIILISTQLIEAGVDIDFPVVYRDICPMPSIIQSGGRCNRNGSNEIPGRLVLFELQKNKKSRADLIYRGRDSRFLNFSKQKLSETQYEEPGLFELQKLFFSDVRKETLFGVHYGSCFIDGEIDFVAEIKKGSFSEVGKFRLIDEDFGEEFRYYIPVKKDDTEFEKLENLFNELKSIKFNDFEKKKLKLIEIDKRLKKMADHVVQIRLKKDDSKPVVSSEPCFGLLKLSKEHYNSRTGICLSNDNQLL